MRVVRVMIPEMEMGLLPGTVKGMCAVKERKIDIVSWEYVSWEYAGNMCSLQHDEFFG